MTMTQMLTATFERLAMLQKNNTNDYPIFNCGENFEINGVGKVHCSLVTAQGATTYMREHFRRKWTLNGKVISAAKLKEIVGE